MFGQCVACKFNQLIQILRWRDTGFNATYPSLFLDLIYGLRKDRAATVNKTPRDELRAALSLYGEEVRRPHVAVGPDCALKIKSALTIAVATDNVDVGSAPVAEV